MKLKIYLDTSVVSALFDPRNPERQLLTQEFFEQSNQYEVYISSLTIAEIMKVNNDVLRQQMTSFIASFNILELEDENKVEILADDLLSYEAVPPKSIEDAYHIAIAIVSGMDYLLSWNFRHIVRLKTRDTVRMVTTLKGYRPITIITPAELS